MNKTTDNNLDMKKKKEEVKKLYPCTVVSLPWRIKFEAGKYYQIYKESNA